MKRLPIIALALACGFAGCKKDSNNAAPTASKTDMLTAKNWRLTADVTTSTFNGTTTTTDDYATMQACEKDDYIKFGTDKKAEFNEGPTKCSTSDPQTQSGTWDFNSDQTKLIVTDPDLGIAIPLELTELSSTTMKLTQKVTSGTNSYSEVMTYTAF